MIDIKTCLQQKYVEKIVGKDENKQSIYEKYVYSMSLLEQLDSLLANKRYVFKGGTSLLLLFKTSSRFSIDVDICMDEDEYDNRDLEQLFKDRIRPPFISVERDVDRNHGGKNIKAAHYLFSYASKYSSDESYILLDVVFQNSVIDGQPIPIDNPLLIQNGNPGNVNTILVDDLLGDKLTAFAPNTIGVKYGAKNQYGRPKSTEIIKQLYDCAFLCHEYKELERVKTIYENIADYQIKCENDNQLSVSKCLEDTIHTCELILSNGVGNKTSYELLIAGMRGFNNYKNGDLITIVDLQKYALIVDIVASMLLKRINPNTRFENKLDYFIRTGIKEKELRLLADVDTLNSFYNNCLIAFK